MARANRSFGLGPRAALRLGRALWCHTLDTLGGLPADVPVVLLTDGPVAPDDRARLGARVVVELDQRGTTFDQRLQDGLARAAAGGFQRLVVVGSDTPELCGSDLRRALAAAPSDTVVGPADDGGIYLLSLPARRLADLAGLPWCSPRLGAALAGRFVDGSLRRLRATRRDVDAADDVAARRRRLDALCRAALGCGLDEEAPRSASSPAARPRRAACAHRAPRAPPSRLTRPR